MFDEDLYREAVTLVDKAINDAAKVFNDMGVSWTATDAIDVGAMIVKEYADHRMIGPQGLLMESYEVERKEKKTKK